MACAEQIRAPGVARPMCGVGSLSGTTQVRPSQSSAFGSTGAAFGCSSTFGCSSAGCTLFEVTAMITPPVVRHYPLARSKPQRRLRLRKMPQVSIDHDIELMTESMKCIRCDSNRHRVILDIKIFPWSVASHDHIPAGAFDMNRLLKTLTSG